MRPLPVAAIFDFDYTLADSSNGIIDCIQSSQVTMDLPVSEPEAIRRTIGLSVPETLVALNGEQQRPRAEQFAELFRARADEVMVGHTRLYDGVPGMFAELSALQIKCAIATTKYRYRIEQILDRDELTDLVDYIVGAEDVEAHKPDPSCLLLSLETLRCSADQAIYVGDSAPDAGAAQRAGIDFVLVETGLAAPGSLDGFPRVVQLNVVTQLPEWLTDHMTVSQES